LFYQVQTFFFAVKIAADFFRVKCPLGHLCRHNLRELSVCSLRRINRTHSALPQLADDFINADLLSDERVFLVSAAAEKTFAKPLAVADIKSSALVS